MLIFAQLMLDRKLNGSFRGKMVEAASYIVLSHARPEHQRGRRRRLSSSVLLINQINVAVAVLFSLTETVTSIAGLPAPRASPSTSPRRCCPRFGGAVSRARRPVCRKLQPAGDVEEARGRW